jgi:hypothetical protein
MRFLDGLVFGSLALQAAARHLTVPGKAFDRFITIWLENTDYDSLSTYLPLPHNRDGQDR